MTTQSPANEASQRKRWSTAAAALLSWIFGAPVALYYRVGAFRGKGSEVGILVAVIIIIIAMFVSMMAAETLAWRLSRRGRAILLTVMVAAALGVLTLAGVLWRNDFKPCGLPGSTILEICRW
jgi:amino acid transporter